MLAAPLLPQVCVPNVCLLQGGTAQASAGHKGDFVHKASLGLAP